MDLSTCFELSNYESNFTLIHEAGDSCITSDVIKGRLTN